MKCSDCEEEFDLTSSDVHAVRELLIRLSPMMRAIEWHMSGDTSRFDEIEAIEESFGDKYKNVTLNALSDKIQELSNELEGMKE